MTKPKQSDRGFGLVEVIIIIFVMALIGLAGWYIWHPKTKPAPSTSSTSQAQSTASSTTTQTAPAAAAQPPAGCKQIGDQQGNITFITLTPTGAKQPCIVVNKNEVIGVTNDIGTTVTVTLGNQSYPANANSGVGFLGAVGSYLQVGDNKLTVSSYTSSQYPSIWVNQ